MRRSRLAAAWLSLWLAGAAQAGPPPETTLLLPQPPSGFTTGFGVATGDVNDDGYDDIVLAQSTYEDGEAFEGAIFLYLGSAAGIASGGPSDADAIVQSNTVNGVFGDSVAVADVNGDGYGDVLASSKTAADATVHIFLGGPGGLASGGLETAAAVLTTPQVGSRFGWSMAGLGDVNGDTYEDVAIGAFAYDVTTNDEGAVFVFHGSAAGIVSGALPATTLLGDTTDAQLGADVAAARDVDDDGFDDLVVTGGSAFVFEGSATGIASGGPANADATLEAQQPAGLGPARASAVAGLGDVNGDGYDDVAVGFGGYRIDPPNTGRYVSGPGLVLVFHSSATGIASGGIDEADMVVRGDELDTGPNQFAGNTGSGVAGGDMNGDGFADLVFADAGFDVFSLPGQVPFQDVDDGFAMLVLGSPLGLLPHVPQRVVRVEGPIFVPSENTSGFLFGIELGSGFDVNGDGRDDWLAGQLVFTSPRSDGVFIFHGEALALAPALGLPGLLMLSVALGFAGARRARATARARAARSIPS